MRENRLEVLHTISNYDLPLFFFVSYVRFPLRLVFLHSGIFCDQLIESIYLFIADFPLIKEKNKTFQTRLFRERPSFWIYQGFRLRVLTRIKCIDQIQSQLFIFNSAFSKSGSNLNRPRDIFTAVGRDHFFYI